jgi:membrane protein DedA with SNARE-associated domain
VAAAAALQNVIPIPTSDLVVLFAAFLAGAGRASPVGVFLAAWIGNAVVADAIYVLARHYRSHFLGSRIGKLMMRGGNIERAVAAQQWGVGAVFISAFLPVRPLLPVLGGIGNVPFWKIALPIAAAAGCWYAGIVFIGMQGGQKFEGVIRSFRVYTKVGIAITVAATLGWFVWWLLHRNKGRTA